MKKWDFAKIIQAILMFLGAIGAIGGAAFAADVTGLIDITPEPVQQAPPYTEPLAAVPGQPVKYNVVVQVEWKYTSTAVPGADYQMVTHNIVMSKIPTLGSTFNEVKALFTAGKIKAPADGFIPMYAYSAEVVSRTGIPLAEPPGKTSPETK